MCFVWIWEQTAIISLYSINWLVFITETECVYCAVRAGSLYIMHVNFHLVYRVRSETTPFQIYGAQSGGTGTAVRLSPVGAAHWPPSSCFWSPSHSTEKYFHFFLVCKRLNRSCWRRQYCTFSNLSYRCALCVPYVHWVVCTIRSDTQGARASPDEGWRLHVRIGRYCAHPSELHKIASGPEWPRVPCCYDVIWFHLNSLCGSFSLRNLKGG